MSTQMANNAPRMENLSASFIKPWIQKERPKVFIPYDGSESAEVALDDLRRAGLPEIFDAKVAVTSVWLPLSPSEITRAVNARRMMVLNAGACSFVPALRDREEQRVLSAEAEHRVRSIFPSGTIKTEAIQDTASVTKEILRNAKRWDADLIVVGAKNSPSPEITDYAGPALKVAQEAHCSVRIARASDRTGDSPVRIVVGMDSPDSADQVVQAVARRVWPRGSEARLIAVRKAGPHNPRMDSQMMLALKQSAEELQARGLRVSTSFREGQPQEVLLEEARDLSADCIFIYADGLKPALNNGSDRRGLSKPTVALVLGAHCSVEVVRPNYFTESYLKPAA